MKLLDKIRKALLKRGYILRNPVKQKQRYAKPGQARIIQPYDFEKDYQEQVAEKARENELPHPL